MDFLPIGITVLGPPPGQFIANIDHGMWKDGYISILHESSYYTGELDNVLKTGTLAKAGKSRIIGDVYELTDKQLKWLKDIAPLLYGVRDELVSLSFDETSIKGESQAE